MIFEIVILYLMVTTVVPEDISYSSSEECVEIYSKSSWEAAQPKNVTKFKNQIEYIVIHHTGGKFCSDIYGCYRILQRLQKAHMDIDPLFYDIDYNFMIDTSGNIYEGTGWDYAGTHCKTYNEKSYGIALIGYYENKKANKRVLNAIKDIIKCGLLTKKLSPSYKIIVHSQTTKILCPGMTVYRQIKEWSRWTSI